MAISIYFLSHPHPSQDEEGWGIRNKRQAIKARG